VGPSGGYGVGDRNVDVQSATELTGYKYPSVNGIRSKNFVCSCNRYNKGAMSFRRFVLRMDKQWGKREMKQNVSACFSLLSFYASKK
jgi:hypothetical protein